MFFRSSRAMLRQVLANQDVIMGKIDDLKGAVTLVIGDFQTYSQEVDAKLAALAAANQDGDGDKVHELTKELTQLHADFQPRITALAATVAPATVTGKAPAAGADTVVSGADTVAGAAGTDTVAGGAAPTA